MIHLFTSNRKNVLPKDRKLINDINEIFNALVLSNRIAIDKTDIEIMRTVDRISAYYNDYVDTPYANRVPITKISTGCKVCILANHLSNCIINIEQAGENALNILYQLDERYYLCRFYNMPSIIELPYAVKVNNSNKMYKDTFELGGIWG